MNLSRLLKGVCQAGPGHEEIAECVSHRWGRVLSLTLGWLNHKIIYATLDIWPVHLLIGSMLMLDTNMDAGGICLTQAERMLSCSPHSPMTSQVDSPEPPLELQHNSLLSAYEYGETFAARLLRTEN